MRRVNEFLRCRYYCSDADLRHLRAKRVCGGQIVYGLCASHKMMLEQMRAK